jgi:putative drug exporter of the RND superfamily
VTVVDREGGARYAAVRMTTDPSPSLQTGIIVAVGVLLDTFVVRSLLVPALAVHIGPRVWWPSRLAGQHAQPVPTQAAAARPAEPT